MTPPLAPVHGKARRNITSRAWWPWLRRGVTAAFFILVGWLLVSQAQSIDWDQVLNALRDYPLTAVTGAIGLMLASYALFSCFDLLGRHYTGHPLHTATVMAITAVCYAFTMNLGSWIGSVAFRYRLYSHQGLSTGIITRVMTLSMLANWTGYTLLAGTIFTFDTPTLPASWFVSTVQLQAVGVALLMLVAGYLGLCAFSRRRLLMLRGHEVALPSFSLALLQVVMGAANWLLMSGIIFVLLQHQVEFSAVISVLLLAAVAGVITHIPGNLGVLEAVFVSLLSHLMPTPQLLAGLVAYRVLYYLVPLCLASAGLVAFEWTARKQRQHALAALERPLQPFQP